jgi:predicted dehydrogenase
MSRLTRRRFLQATALGAVGLCAPRAAAAVKKLSANDRLHVGVIGVTGQGGSDTDQIAAAGAEIVALCDVDENHIGLRKQSFPHAETFTDFRKMLDHKGIDAVLVAIPDHMHAVATLAALRSGRHVYCEKPLAHSLHEVRVVTETAAKHRRVTQMGTQIHGGDNYRRVVELIQTNAIGPVREVHTWVGRDFGVNVRPQPQPVPHGLHWDLWVGTAPYSPYAVYRHGNETRHYHPFWWREWWDFGGGSLADMGCHHMDLPFWALKLHAPTKVSAQGPKPDTRGTPPWLIVDYEFDARGELPPVKLTWYHGGKRPKLFAAGKLPAWGDGNLFVGEKGMLLAGYDNHKLLPEDKFAGFQPPKPFIPRSIGHYKEWVEACKSGATTTCNFGYAGPLTEAVLLGNVAFRSGKTITWDPKAFKTNEPSADEFLYEHYRKPWKL